MQYFFHALFVDSVLLAYKKNLVKCFSCRLAPKNTIISFLCIFQYDRVVRFEYNYYEGYWMYPYNKLRQHGPSYHYTEKEFCESF